jgi:endonuclease-8
MEGPSLAILREELSGFQGRRVSGVSGNAKIELPRLKGQTLGRALSWGKHLLLVFDRDIVKVHFLMFGSYRINERKEQTPRLSLVFGRGHELNIYNSSVRFVPPEDFRNYDWKIDLMSGIWDRRKVLKLARARPDEAVCDLLLDQEVFAGSGNIIKNEVLHRLRIHPETRAGELSPSRLKELVEETHRYSWQFYEWKKRFELKKNWKIYRRRECSYCARKAVLKATGRLQRRSFYCEECQPRGVPARKAA